MKIKEGFVLREIAGNIVVVPTGTLVKEFPTMITLNESGRFLFELLQKADLEVEELTNKLIEKYKIDENRASKDAEMFVKKLKDSGVLQK